MRVRRTHAGWALKAWAFATVFILPFMGAPEVIGWIALGGALGACWWSLPEEPEAPEAPAQKLPFHDQYAHRQVPRRPESDPP